MDKELKKIKKLFGEDMMHFCRDNFALILETPDLLLNTLTSNFNPTHELYKDLEEYGLVLEFKEYIFTKIDKKKEKEIETKETPEELMAQAGYNLYECLTEEDIQKFRKYYAKNEELCTFWTHRLNEARVFFAVKKNVEEIKRKDFSNPKRQDEYGTSVISIQFTKDGTNTLSIKNRYNHTVSNPDATFSNDLDNIISGLTKSFEVYYGLKQKFKNNDFEIPGYVQANDGKYYKYNYEIDNVYYCPDNIIIDNFNVQKYAKEEYLILDYFILDLERKEITPHYKVRDLDCFPKTIGKICKIEIRKENEEKKVLITPIKGEVIEIGLDKLNRIVSYKNNNVKIISKCFLYINTCLRQIEINNVEEICSYFLYNNRILEEISLPKIKEIDNNFLCYNQKLKLLNVPNLRKIGAAFLENNTNLKEINLPNLTSVLDDFLTGNKQIKKLSLPKLESVGHCFLLENNNLEKIEAPNLKTVGDGFLGNNKKLEKMDLPKLETAGHHFLQMAENLKILNLPNLKEIGRFFLEGNKELQVLDLPNLKQVAFGFLEKNNKLTEVHLASLEEIAYNFLYNCKSSLKVFIAPKLREQNDYDTIDSFYRNHPNLEKFIIARPRSLIRFLNND